MDRHLREEARLAAPPITDAGEIARILIRAKALGFYGFSGQCGLAAVALQRAVFDGRGEIVGAFNAALYARGHAIGHVCVRYDDVYWDSDAEPKDEDDITSWGMLDFEDPEYAAIAQRLGVPWTEDAAESVTLVTLSEDRALDLFEPTDLDTMLTLLASARRTETARP